MGIRDAEAIRRTLDIPETEEILAVIALGERKETPDRPRRKTVDDVLKFY